LETSVNTLYVRFAAHIDAALDALQAEGTLVRDLDRRNVTIEPPRDPAHGDMATNAAMVLAKSAGMNPRALADLLVAKLIILDEIISADIAGPGFINLRLSDATWRTELSRN
jgi:arginyl-tRNA synthetase